MRRTTRHIYAIADDYDHVRPVYYAHAYAGFKYNMLSS